MDPISQTNVGGQRTDTGAIAKEAAAVLERVRAARAEHLAPLSHGGASSVWTSRALNVVERHALVAQRYCVQSLTARLRNDDPEVARLAEAAATELAAAHEVLAGLDVAEPDDLLPPPPQRGSDDESEIEAASHLDDDPEWSARMPAPDSTAARHRPEPDMPSSATTTEAPPPDHEPVPRRVSSAIEEDLPERRPTIVSGDADVEVVPTAAERAQRGRKTRKLLSFLLVAIVIIGVVLIVTGSSLFG